MKKTFRSVSLAFKNIADFFKEKSVLRGWAMLLILLTVSVFASFLAFKSATENIVSSFASRYNDFFLAKIQENCDDCFDTIYKNAYKISNDEIVTYMLAQKSENTAANRLAVNELYKHLNESYNTREKLSFQISFCNNADNNVIAKSGINTVRDAYEPVVGMDYIDEFIKILEKNKKGYYAVGNFIVYMDDNGTAGYSTVIMVEKMNFFLYLGSLQYLPTGTIEVYNPENTLILSLGDRIEEPVVAGDINSNGLFEKKYKNKNYIINEIVSEISGWRFLMYLEKTEYLSELTDFKKSFLLIFALLILLFAGFLVLYIKNTYKPFKYFVNFFGLSNDNIVNNENEYEKIIRAYKNLKSENAKRDIMIYNQDKLLLDSILSSVLSDGEIYRNTPPEVIDKFDLFSKYNRWCAVEFVTEPSEYSYEETRTIISNIFEELLENQNMTGRMISGKEYYACAVGFMCDEKEGINKLKTAIEYMQSVTEKYFSIMFKTVIGGVYGEIELLKKSFRDAEKAMYYKIFYSIEGIVYFAELKDIESKKDSPEEMVNTLAGFIKEKKINEAAEYVFMNFDVENNYSKTGNSVFNVVNMFLLLISKALDSVMLNKDKYYEQLNMLSDKDSSYGRKKEIIFGIITDLTQDISEVVNQDIAQYIQDNYSNPELSVQYIADAFDVHPNTLTSRFKTELGVGVLWYIHYTRIKNSKELLKDDNLTLEEIALKVGYSNAKTYIRNFKKFENVTPRAYIESKEIL
ncbi:MAG: AraC family transcriptional regulator [Clostridia bacterium]|nr:AraC family transcriptional regulator [Clostridia bacterium]